MRITLQYISPYIVRLSGSMVCLCWGRGAVCLYQPLDSSLSLSWSVCVSDGSNVPWSDLGEMFVCLSLSLACALSLLPFSNRR